MKDERSKYGLIIEIGNSQTKACIFSYDGKLYEYSFFPSYICEEGIEGEIYRGTYELANKTYIIGEAARILYEQHDDESSFKLVELPNGKDEYFPWFVAAVIADLQNKLELQADVNVFFVSLTRRTNTDFNRKLSILKNIKIRGEIFDYKFNFAQFLPEGLGGAFLLESIMNKSGRKIDELSILDLGDGTIIYQIYRKTRDGSWEGLPIEPVDCGANVLIRTIFKIARNKLPSFREINKPAFYESLFNNSYSYARTKRVVVNFETEIIEAVRLWLNSRRMSHLITELKANISRSIPTICIGGGWGLNIVRTELRSMMIRETKMSEDKIDELVYFADNPRYAGFLALAESIRKREIAKDS